LSVKKCTPSLFLQSVVGQSIQSRTARQACAQQTEKSHSHTTSAVSRQVFYVHALLVQHLYSVLFQHVVWYGPTSERVWMQRRQKNWLKYTDFTEPKKIAIRINTNCLNYSFLFKSFKFCCCSFCLIKKRIYSELYRRAAFLLLTL